VPTPAGYSARLESWSRARAYRVRHGVGPILQTAVATGIAWAVCTLADAVELLRGALRSLGRWVAAGEESLRLTTRRDAEWAGAAESEP
jgi:hypothetical protein